VRALETKARTARPTADGFDFLSVQISQIRVIYVLFSNYEVAVFLGSHLSVGYA